MTERPLAPTVAAALLKLDRLGTCKYWGDFALQPIPGGGRPRYLFNCMRHVRPYIVDLKALDRAVAPDELVESLWALNQAGRAAVAKLKGQA